MYFINCVKMDQSLFTNLKISEMLSAFFILINSEFMVF